MRRRRPLRDGRVRHHDLAHAVGRDRRTHAHAVRDRELAVGAALDRDVGDRHRSRCRVGQADGRLLSTGGHDRGRELEAARDERHRLDRPGRGGPRRRPRADRRARAARTRPGRRPARRHRRAPRRVGGLVGVGVGTVGGGTVVDVAGGVVPPSVGGVVVGVVGSSPVARAHTWPPVANRASVVSAVPFALSNTAMAPSPETTGPDTDAPADVRVSVPIDSERSLTFSNGPAPPTQRCRWTSVEVSYTTTLPSVEIVGRPAPAARTSAVPATIEEHDERCRRAGRAGRREIGAARLEHHDPPVSRHRRRRRSRGARTSGRRDRRELDRRSGRPGSVRVAPHEHVGR